MSFSKFSRSAHTFLLWFIGAIVILLLWIGSYVYFSLFLSNLSWSERGSIGDTFGAVNVASLFVFNLVMIVYLIFLIVYPDFL